ncbi:hypothetical protein H2199_004293 [Coniosporium tulheliwenetii]|uniref:Uncharacterized protein n=1 Tax=Coniosporium tulheliwenetii TaxID=3383036 RepID=A0ACC2Z8D2_9PEZI|nr:hypothetical protein H2199_004293 [Cladosporium sp. JES 115]
MENVVQGKATTEETDALKAFARGVISVIDKEARKTDLRDRETAIREHQAALRERENAARERETTAADCQSTRAGSTQHADRPRGAIERFPDRRTERRRGRELEERLYQIGETASALVDQAGRLLKNLRYVDGRE